MMVETVFFSIFIGIILTLVFLMFFMLGHTETGGNDLDAETVVIILQNLEMPLSQGERQAVDYAIESIRIREKLEEYFERMENK